MINVASLWNSKDEGLWKKSMENYWNLIKQENILLEKEMERLVPANINNLGENEWFEFLLKQYFKWKYTAPNRYGSTTKHLKAYKENNRLGELLYIRDRILASGESGDIGNALTVTKEIKGLGIAGASGLLALLFPEKFATVDQFVVKALRKVPGLPERELLDRMNPESLSLQDGVILIRIMKQKADELNNIFKTNYWTPRKIDIILWAIERKGYLITG